MAQTQLGTADDLEPPTQLHQQAVFGETEQARTKARQQIRANSAYGPGFWNELDGAFKYGYLQPQPREGTSMRANSQLMDYDEWVNKSDEVLEEVEVEVTLMDDALGIDQVSHDLSYTIYTEQVESEGDMEAEISMDGRAKGKDGGSVKVPIGVAVPIIHVDYDLSSREQAQSTNMGNDLEARKARGAGRELRYAEDELILDGWGLSIEGPNGQTFSVDGYRTTDARITGSATGSWATDTPGNVQDTVEDMIQVLETQGTESDRNIMPRSQGVIVYYNTAKNKVFDQESARGDGDESVRQRLTSDHPYVTLRETPRIPEDEVVAVVRDPEMMSVVNAQGPTNLSWDAGPMATNYKAMSSRVPFFRSTFDDVSSVVHYTGA